MMKKTVILTGLLLFGTSVFADADKAVGLKIGYVDMSSAIRSTQAGKDAEKKLEQEFKKKQEELGAKEGDLKTMLENLEKQANVISPEVRSQKERALQEEQLQYQKMVAESRLAIQQRERELTEPILEKMQKIIDEIAKEKKYDMILQKAEITILWAKPELDLTAEVIKRFDESKKKDDKSKK